MSSETLQQVALESSQDEINDHEVYRRLSRLRIEKNQVSSGRYSRALSEMEHRRYDDLEEVHPCCEGRRFEAVLRVYLSILLRVLFGTTFRQQKFLERNESSVIQKVCKDAACT